MQISNKPEEKLEPVSYKTTINNELEIKLKAEKELDPKINLNQHSQINIDKNKEIDPQELANS